MNEKNIKRCASSHITFPEANSVDMVKSVTKTRRWKDFSLSLGCMKCNVLATRVRRRIQLILFGFGCWIQKNNLFTFVTGFIILLGLCVGLKKAQEETNIQRLWVQAGGRLEKEISYTERFYGAGGFKTSIEAFIQKNKWGSQNILHIESLEEHLNMMKKVMEMNVYVHQDQWTLSDLCQKTSFGEVGDSYLHFDRILEHFTPCYIITPLDCFWEGSKIAGPQTPLRVPILRKQITWSNTDPQQLIKDLVAAKIKIPETTLNKLFQRAGVTKGYLEKPCLNPRSSECPKTAPNFDQKQLTDIGKVLTGGCTGFAAKILKWPEELIVGGIKRDSKGVISSAKALQSVLYLLSPRDVFIKHRHSKGRSVRGWSPYKAEQVVKAWQREYTKLVNSLGFNNDSTSSQMLAFSSTSFYDLINNFSKINIMKIALGYGLMAVYAIITLKRWTDSVFSYGLVGLIGVVVVSLSVGAALGLCSLLKLTFNAASTQILPFLALGLGVDDMFIVARTYVNISESGEVEEKEILGECLEKSGLSITLTSFTNAVAFTMASIVPVPALQDFARQAAMIVVFNFLSVFFVFTSTLAFDIKRIKQKSYDLFICFGREEPTPQTTPSVLQQDVAFINLDGRTDGSSICAGASVAAYIEKDKDQPNRSFTIRTDTHKNNFGTPWSTQRVQSDREKQPRETASNKNQESKLCLLLQKLSFSYFADVYFSVWLQSLPIKIFVLFIFAIFVGVCAYGAFQVTSGLDPSEMVPRGSAEHHFVESQFKYFNFYQIYAVTMEKTDYPNNQKLLHSLHRSFGEVKNVAMNEKQNTKPFWLVYFRQWLLDVEKTFKKEWLEGRFHQYGWYGNASKDAVLGFKLLLVSEDRKRPQNFSRIPNGRLVDDNGVILPSCFYHYLTAWYNADVLGYQASEMGLRPIPPLWNNFMDIRIPINSSDNLIPKASPIQIALMPFYAHGMKTNKDFLDLIKNFREVCTEFTKRGLPTYPQGIPFTYWEQYVNLGRHLWLSIGLIFIATFIVLALSLMNVWGAAITTLILASITFELFGVIGLLGLRLSAVPVVTIITSVGVGVEFTVHICLAFISAQGSRNERIKTAITRLFTPIIDGVMSTFLGIIMLASSEFDFVKRYFFDLILALVLIGAANGLLLLPVLLSFFGPCCEVTHRRVNPCIEERAMSVFPDNEKSNLRIVNPNDKSGSAKDGAIILQMLDHEPVRLPKVRTDLTNQKHGTFVTTKGTDPFSTLKSARDPFNTQGRRELTNHRTRKLRHGGNIRTVSKKLSPVPEICTPDGIEPGRQSSSSTSTLKPSRPGTPITTCLPLQYHETDNEIPDCCVEDMDDFEEQVDYPINQNQNRNLSVRKDGLPGGTKTNVRMHPRSNSNSVLKEKPKNRDEYIPEYVYQRAVPTAKIPGKPCRVTEVDSDDDEQVTKVTATATVTVEVRSQQNKSRRVQRVYHSANNDPYQCCGLPEPQ